MVSFTNIPSNLRTPHVFVEVDGSKAGNRVNNNVPLIIGQKLSAGSQPALTAVRVSSAEQANSYFGAGSNLAEMIATYKENDAFTELWAFPVDDNGAGTAATGTILITGTATAAGTLNLYIAGTRIQVAVASGDAATDVGDTIVADIATAKVGVTGVNTTGSVALTHVHKGEVGNDYPVYESFAGVNGGEETPAGLTVEITQLSSGATNPDMDTTLAALGSEQYEYFLFPWNDSTTLDSFRDWMDDANGRWSPLQQLYGMGFTGLSGSYATLAAAGALRNDQHTSIMGVYDSPNPAYSWASAYMAKAAKALNIDPATPHHNLVMKGVLSPKAESRFSHTENNALLFTGIATFVVRSDGQPQIQRSITTYRENGFGDPDSTYLDIQTLAILSYFNREVIYRIQTKYGEHKLVNDGTKLGAGQAAVSPAIMRAEFVSMYSELITLGLVENMAAFKENMTVVRNENDVNRLDVILTPDLANMFIVGAIKVEFRLQF